MFFCFSYIQKKKMIYNIAEVKSRTGKMKVLHQHDYFCVFHLCGSTYAVMVHSY